MCGPKHYVCISIPVSIRELPGSHSDRGPLTVGLPWTNILAVKPQVFDDISSVATHNE